MKKILFVDNNLKIGGIQKALVNLLNEIADEYEITLALFTDKGEYRKQLPKNINIVYVGGKLKILGLNQSEARQEGTLCALSRGACALFSKEFGNAMPIHLTVGHKKYFSQYDYGISFMQMAPKKQFFGGTNEFLLNCVEAKRKIGFIHGDFRQYGGDVEYAGKQYRRMDRIAACSQGCAEALLSVLPDLRGKVFTVRNCSPYDEIRLLADHDPPVYKDDEINLITVARLSEEKRIDRALMAAAYCIENGVRLHYHIVGDGPERARLEQMAEQRNIAHCVTFYGNQENPYRFMKNADLFLLTSCHEAAPMVFDEARCLHLPVLTTETTSTDEMIVRQHAGRVCENSESGIQNSLLELLRNPEQIWQMKAELRAQVCGNGPALDQFRRLLDFEE